MECTRQIYFKRCFNIFIIYFKISKGKINVIVILEVVTFAIFSRNAKTTLALIKKGCEAMKTITELLDGSKRHGTQ